MVTSEWCASGTESNALGPCAIADHPPCGNVSTRRVPRGVSAQGGDLDLMGRLFGTRIINDGTGMIQLDLPHRVSREADVPLSVQVNWSLVLTKAVARLYLIADGNRNALLTSVSLIPDLVPPHVCMNVRLDGSTDVRAVVECGDGTLLQVKRWVRVMPHDLDALPSNGACGAHPRQEDGSDMTSTLRPMPFGEGCGISRSPAGADPQDGLDRRAPHDEDWA